MRSLLYLRVDHVRCLVEAKGVRSPGLTYLASLRSDLLCQTVRVLVQRDAHTLFRRESLVRTTRPKEFNQIVERAHFATSGSIMLAASCHPRTYRKILSGSPG